MTVISKTEVQGIKADALLHQFEELKGQLAEIQKYVTPKDNVILLTRKEVAKMLGISLPTLHSWVKNGILVSYHIGSKVRFKKDEVLQSLKSINDKNTAK